MALFFQNGALAAEAQRISAYGAYGPIGSSLAVLWYPSGTIWRSMELLLPRVCAKVSPWAAICDQEFKARQARRRALKCWHHSGRQMLEKHGPKRPLSAFWRGIVSQPCPFSLNWRICASLKRFGAPLEAFWASAGGW